VKRGDLIEFVRESNRIEGIIREPTAEEATNLKLFIKLDRLDVARVQDFVWFSTEGAADLRKFFGMDVIVGSHRPPPGGDDIESELDELLWEMWDGHVDPYHGHVRYELLHPFMDGNGRSGRAVWAWHMRHNGLDPFSLPFLHRFYYQALDASRSFSFSPSPIQEAES
jgi:Fic family protein